MIIKNYPCIDLHGGAVRFGCLVVRAPREAVVPGVFLQGFPAGIDMIIPYENLTNDIDTVEQSVRHPKASDYNKFASKYKVLNTIADDAVVFIANEGCDIGTCNQISDRYGRHIQLTLRKEFVDGARMLKQKPSSSTLLLPTDFPVASNPYFAIVAYHHGKGYYIEFIGGVYGFVGEKKKSKYPPIRKIVSVMINENDPVARVPLLANSGGIMKTSGNATYMKFVLDENHSVGDGDDTDDTVSTAGVPPIFSTEELALLALAPTDIKKLYTARLLLEVIEPTVQGLANIVKTLKAGVRHHEVSTVCKKRTPGFTAAIVNVANVDLKKLEVLESCHEFEIKLCTKIAAILHDKFNIGGNADEVKKAMETYVTFSRLQGALYSLPHVRFSAGILKAFEKESDDSKKAFIVIMPLSPKKSMYVRYWKTPFGLSVGSPDGQVSEKVLIGENQFIMLPANCVHTEEVPDNDTLFCVMVVVPIEQTDFGESSLFYATADNTEILADIYTTTD